MYLADCHVHTSVSADAEVPMAELAKLALNAGMDEVCFTDHVEPEVVFGTRFDWNLLTAEFEKAQQAMGNQIRLRMGIELGDDPVPGAKWLKLYREFCKKQQKRERNFQ